MKKAIFSLVVILMTVSAVVMASPSTVAKPKHKCTTACCSCKSCSCTDCKCKDGKCSDGKCSGCANGKCVMPSGTANTCAPKMACCGK